MKLSGEAQINLRIYGSEDLRIYLRIYEPAAALLARFEILK